MPIASLRTTMRTTRGSVVFRCFRRPRDRRASDAKLLRSPSASESERLTLQSETFKSPRRATYQLRSLP